MHRFKTRSLAPVMTVALATHIPGAGAALAQTDQAKVEQAQSDQAQPSTNSSSGLDSAVLGSEQLDLGSVMDLEEDGPWATAAQAFSLIFGVGAMAYVGYALIKFLVDMSLRV